jgi:hypothetical protein
MTLERSRQQTDKLGRKESRKGSKHTAVRYDDDADTDADTDAG